MINPYEVLGVSKNSTAEEIQNAYRKLVLKYHPDHNQGDKNAVEKLKEINSAFEILSDPLQKARYDNGRRGPTFTGFQTKRKPKEDKTSENYSYEDVVADFFGGSVYKGRNITVRLEIDLKEVYSGCKKYIKIKKRKRCTTCSGRGFSGFTPCGNCKGSGAVQTADAPFQFLTQCQICQGTGKASVVKCGDCLGTCFLPGFFEKDLEVSIPAGVENGIQIRIAGEGEESIRGGNSVDGRAGDVMVFVIVKDHHIFQRQGLDLLAEVPVSYTELVLGGDMELNTLSGELIKVRIPEGTQSHTKFRLKGKGLIVGNKQGDIIATVKIETPKNINEEYKKTLQELSQLEKTFVTPRREQWSKNFNTSSK